jgi:hypothetical protein
LLTWSNQEISMQINRRKIADDFLRRLLACLPGANKDKLVGMELRPASENDFHPVPGSFLRHISGSRRFFSRNFSAGRAITLLALLVWLVVHGDFGMTADEPVQSRYGEAVRNYIAGNVAYGEFLQGPGLPKNIFNYGPALDLFCATLAHFFRGDIFSVRHGVQGLFWVAMFYPVCALGRKIAGRTGAWFSGLALMGMPGLLGQAFNNPKDLPLACAAVWLLHVTVATATRRRTNWLTILPLGLAVGFVLMTRPGAWFLCALLGLLPLASFWRTRTITGEWQAKKLLWPLPVLFAAFCLGWLLMVLPWPNAWHSPLRHPAHAAGFAAHFDENYPVLFRGTVFTSNRLPWDYLLTYLALTLPLPLLVFVLWGHVVLWRKAFCTTAKAAAALGVFFVLWFPLAAFVILRPNIYNGMRHFLFVLPPLAVLAGVAAADVFRRLQTTVPRNILLPGAVLLLLSAGPAMVRLHPYENVFYNVLAGSKATLNQRYETDYWFSSYREAAQWVNATQARSGQPLRVLVAGLNFYAPVFLHYVNSKTQTTLAGIGDMAGYPLPPEYDYYVGTVNYFQWLNFPNAPIVHRIERDGITLAIIRANPQRQKP